MVLWGMNNIDGLKKSMVFSREFVYVKFTWFSF